jgi:Uma2 family endonuclease
VNTPSGITLREYLDLPESRSPQELVDGVLRVADSPLVPHQLAVGDLLCAISAHVHDRQLGEVLAAPLDVILDVDRPLVVQPDLLFVSNARRHVISDRIFGAPDLIVEVLSPYPRVGRLEERIGWFAQYGVRECWLLHQEERRLAVLELGPGGIGGRQVFETADPIRSAVLPDLHAPVGAMLRWRF